VKTRIDINDVKRLLARRDEINRLELKDIAWMDGDKEIDIPLERLEQWRFVGLSNLCFVEFGMHEHGFEDADEVFYNSLGSKMFKENG